jgi:hypothetical protein
MGTARAELMLLVALRADCAEARLPPLLLPVVEA